MAGFSLTEKAERDLDEIWLYIARESGSIETASRVTDSIYSRFWLLSDYPYAGRSRDDLFPGLRTLPADRYIVVYEIGENSPGEKLAFILHVVHSSRDLLAAIQEGNA